MQYFIPEPNSAFVGRQKEWDILNKIDKNEAASIVVVYGRRRVGKTELIEQFFREKHLLKFEGLESSPFLNQKERQETIKRQISFCITRLGKYLAQEDIFRSIKGENWAQFFELLAAATKKQTVALYFEEIQWLSVYGDEFFAEFKPFWDDHFRLNNKLRVIFSGSLPTFILNQFLSNKALYNRSEHEIKLKPFDLNEISIYLKKFGKTEQLHAALLLGGIPEYLKQVKTEKSFFLGLCENSFKSNSFFLKEFDKIFVSTLSKNIHYKQIIELLANKRYCTRTQIINALRLKPKQGGSLTKILRDLESLDFIASVTPLVRSKGSHSKLVRYAINDEYLNYYYKFIHKLRHKILKGQYDTNPQTALNRQSLQIGLGFAFERWCVKNAFRIATILGFHGIVDYEAGSYFDRNLETTNPGFQIDLMYIRKDARLLFCEIKYSEIQINSTVISEVNKKAELFLLNNPKFKNYTIVKILITNLSAESIREDIKSSFDNVIDIDKLF